MNKPTIDKIRVRFFLDQDPDTSYLGEYTDNLEPGVIIRQEGEFYEHLPAEMKRDADGRFTGKAEPYLPPIGREYRGFKPHAGGEIPGTKNYYKYGMQDFKDMESLNNGDWCFVGIRADATVQYYVGNNNYRLKQLTSAGIWGVESNADDSFINEMKNEELANLKNHLEQFNVDTSNWNELTASIDIDDIDIEYR